MGHLYALDATLIAGDGIEPSNTRLWAWRVTATLPRIRVGGRALSPCLRVYSTLPIDEALSTTTRRSAA